MSHSVSTAEARTNPLALHDVKRDDVNSRILDAVLRHRTMLVLAENGVVNDILKILNPIIISIFKLIRDPKSPLMMESVNIAQTEIHKVNNRQTEITEDTPVSPQVASSVADSLTDLIQTRIEKSEAQVGAVIKDALFEVANTEFEVMKELVTRNIPKKINDELALASLRIPEAKRIIRGGIGGELDQVAIDKIVNNPLGGGYAPRLKQRYGASLNRVREVLKNGMIAGTDVPTIGRRVKGVLDFELRGGAARLARTEIHRVAAEAQDEMYAQNKDIIKQRTWTTALDANVCLRCAQLDGQSFDVGKGPKIPLHPNCRCTYAPVTKSWSELGIGGGKLSFLEKQAMNGKIPGRTSFMDFFLSQGKGFQKQVLGPTRFDLYSKGAIRFDQLATAQRIKPIKELLKIAKKPVKKAIKKIAKKVAIKRVPIKRVMIKKVPKKKVVKKVVKKKKAPPQAGAPDTTATWPGIGPQPPKPPTPGVRKASVPGAEHPSFSVAKSTPEQVDAAFLDVMTERAHELTKGNIVNRATLATDLGGANANAFSRTKEQIEGFYKGWGWNTKFAKGPPGAATWKNKIIMHDRVRLGLGRLWEERLLKPWMKRRAPSRIPGFTGLPPDASIRTMRALYLQDPEKAAMFKNLVHENIHIIGRTPATPLIPGAGPFSPDAKAYTQKAFRALEEGLTETLANQEYKGVAKRMFGFSEAEAAAIADAPKTSYKGWESILDDLDPHMPKATQGKQWVSKLKYSTKLENGFDEMASLMSEGMVEQGFASLDSATRKNLAKELYDMFDGSNSLTGITNQKQRIADAVSHAIGKVVPVPTPTPMPVAPPPIVPLKPPSIPQIKGLRAKVSQRIRDAIDEDFRRTGADFATIHPSSVGEASNNIIDNVMKALNPRMSPNAQNRLKSRYINSSWKSSSSDPSSLGMRQALNETFGGKVYRSRELMNAATVRAEIHTAWDVSLLPKEVDEIIDGFKDWVQIRYEVTQRALDSQGVGSTILHRGVRAGETSLGRVNVGEKVILKRSTGSGSSFSSRKGTADGFGDITFKTKVKKENIFGNYDTGLGVGSEKEWVVLGDETDFLVKITRNNIRRKLTPFGTVKVDPVLGPSQIAKRRIKKLAKKKLKLKKLKLKRQKLVAKKKEFKAVQKLKKEKLKLKKAKARVDVKLRRDKLRAEKKRIQARKLKARIKVIRKKRVAKKVKARQIRTRPTPTPEPAPPEAPRAVKAAPKKAKPQKTVPSKKGDAHPKIAKKVSTVDEYGDAFADVFDEHFKSFGGTPLHADLWKERLTGNMKNAFVKSDKEVRAIMNNKNVFGKADWNGDVWLNFEKRREVARLFDEKKLTDWLLDEFEDLEDEILDWSLKAKRAKYLSVPSHSESFGTYVHEVTHLQGRTFGADAFADKALYQRIEFRIMEEGLTETIALKDSAGIAGKMFGFDATQMASIPSPANGYKTWTDMLETTTRHLTANLRRDRVWINKLKYESKLSDSFKTLAKWIDDGIVERGGKTLSTEGLKALETNLQRVFAGIDKGQYTIDNAVTAAMRGVTI